MTSDNLEHESGSIFERIEMVFAELMIPSFVCTACITLADLYQGIMDSIQATRYLETGSGLNLSFAAQNRRS
jgi:hypothetical protein